MNLLPSTSILVLKRATVICICIFTDGKGDLYVN